MDMELARQLIDQYGYLAVFLSTIIEGEVVVLAAAALAANGLLQPHWVIAAAAAGAFIGHILLFALGRWKGMQLIESFSFLRRHYPIANKVMDDYANWSVFIFQYLYGTRIISAILFGCSTISVSRFFLLQSINCIIWAFVAYIAGHMIGIIAMRIFDMLGLYGLLAVILVAGIVMLKLYHHFAHQHVLAFLSDNRDIGIEQADANEGRHFLLEQLTYHISLVKRNDQPLTLLLFKISTKDKTANKNTLTFISQELSLLLRDADIPARFSRNTYAIILPNTSNKNTKKSVRRLMRQMQQDLPKHEHLAAISIGHAQWKTKMNSGQLLDKAYSNITALQQIE
ncbi:MAG: VTT domain-containing protein [Mariprofundus sp.]|nr:VTT domain-containing protein [Mariprofundus sp.]